MDAYRVSARVDRGTPRRRQRLRARVDEPAGGVELAPVDMVGRPIEVTIGERLDTLRERWSQTTFFLFDPDSWRS